MEAHGDSPPNGQSADCGRVTPHSLIEDPDLGSPLPQKAKTEATIMLRKIIILSFLAVAAFTVGCDKRNATDQHPAKVEVKTADIERDIKNYTSEQRAEFMEKMQRQLTEINHDLDQLATKIEKSSDSVRAKAKPKLQALRDHAAQLSNQLEEVRNTTKSTLESVKAGSKTAYNDSKDGFNPAHQWVSEKNAP